MMERVCYEDQGRGLGVTIRCVYRTVIRLARGGGYRGSFYIVLVSIAESVLGRCCLGVEEEQVRSSEHRGLEPEL